MFQRYAMGRGSRQPTARIPQASLLLLLLAPPAPGSAQESGPAGSPPGAEQIGSRGDGLPGHGIFIPRVTRPPALDDFTGMRPPLQVREQFARVSDFVQRAPSDGQPATRPTEVYLGYDDAHLYAVFLAHDDEPAAIRARMSRREDIGSDDLVTLTIDTDGDRQRGYEFIANPFGIQRDALWTEGREPDFSFDTLWESEGTLTDGGYVVIMSIPFKSLRFPRREVQTWGIVLWRWVPRGNAEESTWPHVSSRIEGVLNQSGPITGMTRISPGRNLRFIPYGTFRSFRSIGETQRGPDFITEPADPDAGLDAKIVVGDTVVVDGTINPDFSQIESDQPQNTVNRRFEVFFPEKRPFFLENANYFETPLNLLFTRRIADPQFGVRATGKLGGWALGALAIDDRAPGRLAPAGDVGSGARARHGAFRVSRDLGTQSNLGLLYVDRSFAGTYNRVGGLDGRVKLDSNWTTTFQAVASDTRGTDNETRSGSAYTVQLRRQGRKLDYTLELRDISEGFRAQSGFVPRVGFRSLLQILDYDFRPEGSVLIGHGPGIWLEEIRDHDGEPLERSINPWYSFDLTGQTNFGVFYWGQNLRLRPRDSPALQADRTYDTGTYGFWFNTKILRALELNASRNSGTSMNFVPASGRPPEESSQIEGNLTVAYRPGDHIRLSARWLYQSLNERSTSARIFRSDILRGRLDWQLSRELSLRLIIQYQSLATNPRLTTLTDRRGINADVLATYLLNPWTSLFVGYNSNYENLVLHRHGGFNQLERSGGRFLNDARQFFVKASYLFSY